MTAPAVRVAGVAVPTVLTAAVSSGSVLALVLSGSLAVGLGAGPLGGARSALPGVEAPAELSAPPRPVPDDVVADDADDADDPDGADGADDGADDGAVPAAFRRTPAPLPTSRAEPPGRGDGAPDLPAPVGPGDPAGPVDPTDPVGPGRPTDPADPVVPPASWPDVQCRVVPGLPPLCRFVEPVAVPGRPDPVVCAVPLRRPTGDCRGPVVAQPPSAREEKDTRVEAPRPRTATGKGTYEEPAREKAGEKAGEKGGEKAGREKAGREKAAREKAAREKAGSASGAQPRPRPTTRPGSGTAAGGRFAERRRAAVGGGTAGARG